MSAYSRSLLILYHISCTPASHRRYAYRMTLHCLCHGSFPMQSTYSAYTNNAVFHDPIGVAEGIDSIRAQFNGLAKVHTNFVWCMVLITTAHTTFAS